MARDNRPTDVRDHFDQTDHVNEIRDAYTETAADQFSVFTRLRKDLIISQVKAMHPTGRVLEIGCGTGELAIELAEAGFQCLAVDISDAMISEAREKVSDALRDRIEFRAANVFDADFAGPFDIVIANGVIPYYPDKDAFLQKLADQLKSTGTLFITHRNALFNMFALNQGTTEFFEEFLTMHLSARGRASYIRELVSKIAGLGSAKQAWSNTSIYRGQEVPMEMTALYARANMAVEKISACCIHVMPPRLGDGMPEILLKAQACYQDDWRGLFMGSQFLVIARKTATA